MATGGTWFVSRSGIIWDVAEPTESMIYWPDLAESMAKQCRWNGHCRGFYSVAQHCVLVSKLVDPTLRAHALLHDAHEAFLGDIIRPVKVVLGDALKDVEKRLDQVIYGAAGLDKLTDVQRDRIKDADMRALATERRDIMVRPVDSYTKFVPAETGWIPDPDPIRPVPWNEAKRMWLEHFRMAWVLHRGVSITFDETEKWFPEDWFREEEA